MSIGRGKTLAPGHFVRTTGAYAVDGGSSWYCHDSNAVGAPIHANGQERSYHRAWNAARDHVKQAEAIAAVDAEDGRP
jgi:hypothetical protein